MSSGSRSDGETGGKKNISGKCIIIVLGKYFISVSSSMYHVNVNDENTIERYAYYPFLFIGHICEFYENILLSSSYNYPHPMIFILSFLSYHPIIFILSSLSYHFHPMILILSFSSYHSHPIILILSSSFYYSRPIILILLYFLPIIL